MKRLKQRTQQKLKKIVRSRIKRKGHLVEEVKGMVEVDTGVATVEVMVEEGVMEEVMVALLASEVEFMVEVDMEMITAEAMVEVMMTMEWATVGDMTITEEGTVEDMTIMAVEEEATRTTTREVLSATAVVMVDRR